ncbi:MAG: Gfo/Idh/MocA family oxidoreductase [Geminicoccaceae bacterium]|nr:Gfo/Idh/MocA family oxidoreductase [Geminicoccaceae bacterium]MDW8370102.1 Gfo/Idh/MocA family oxidoreductase [Geminicoccaceae bacterium]
MRHRVLVIGLGAAMAPHLESLLELADRVEIAAAWSRSAARRTAFAERFPGVRVAEDLDTLLADPSIDLALLLTPPDAREGFVRRLAAAGKHVLCEKPLERTASAALRIVRVCEAARVRLAVMLQMRMRPASVRLRELLQEGRLGELGFVEIRIPWWRPQSYYDEPGRGTFVRDGGGVLLTQAIHTLDLALHLLGPVREVAGLATTTGLHRMESEDFATAGLLFESGLAGSLFATTACYPGGPERVEIVGSEAAAVLEGGGLALRRPDGAVERLVEPERSGAGAAFMDFPHDAHRAVIADVLDAIDEGREPLCSGRSALAVQHLVEAILRSSRSGRREPVPS